MKAHGAVTLAEIAARLGCDKSTVSLALRGDARISAATKERVRRQAEELGYRPDPALKRLATLRWGGRAARPAVSIAMVARSRRDYPRIRAKLERATERWVRGAGYGFERIFLDDYPNGAAAARVLRARGAGGLIVMASATEGGLRGFAWEDWPLVQVMEGVDNLKSAPVVAADDFGSLLDAGRRVEAAKPESAAICLLGQRHASRSDEQALAAAMLVTDRWTRAGVACEAPRVFTNPPGGSDGLRAMAEWLAAARPRLAVVANSSVGAFLAKAGVRPRRPLRLVALRVLGEPGWAGYERDFDAIGAAAAQRVDWMIRQGKRGPMVRPDLTLVPDVWCEGETFA